MHNIYSKHKILTNLNIFDEELVLFYGERIELVDKLMCYTFLKRMLSYLYLISYYLMGATFVSIELTTTQQTTSTAQNLLICGLLHTFM